MPSSGLPIAVRRSAAQKLPHPMDTQQNAVAQNAYNVAACRATGVPGTTFAVPAAAVMPTAADSQFDLIVGLAYNAKKGTDAMPQ